MATGEWMPNPCLTVPQCFNLKQLHPGLVLNIKMSKNVNKQTVGYGLGSASTLSDLFRFRQKYAVQSHTLIATSACAVVLIAKQWFELDDNIGMLTTSKQTN